MRLILALVAVGSLAACNGGGDESVLTAPSLSGTDVVTTTPISNEAPKTVEASNNSMQALLNQARTNNGVGTPVSFDNRLQQAAAAHAGDMLANDFFSHTGSDGSNVGDRATRAGYNWAAIGENLGVGQQSEGEVHNGWMGSPGHRANNLNPDYDEFGLAQAGTGAKRYWVLVLGREQ